MFVARDTDYDDSEVRVKKDSLGGTGALLSQLARREPRLRLHASPSWSLVAEPPALHRLGSHM